MKSVLFCWMFVQGIAVAEESSVRIKEVNTAQAVEAMSVLEADEVVEAAEVEKTIQRTSGTNDVDLVKATSPTLIEKLIKKVKPKVEPQEDVVDPWVAFMPPPDREFDWIQLTSGEWLKGKFKVLYEHELEFDSDKMGLRTFTFEDVKRMRTRDMKTIFIQGEGGPRDTQVLRGMLEVKDHEIILRRSEYTVVVPRSRVISIISGRQRERENWSGMVAFGVNARAGNTETMDATVISTVKRRTVATRFEADYLANYSQSKKEESANNQRLNGSFDRFMTTVFFWQILAGEYYRDPFSNIDAQYSLSSGAGYDIVQTSKTEWGLDWGLGYQKQKFVSVEEGAADHSASAFASFGTSYDHKMTGNIDFLFDYSMRWLNEDNGTYTHHMLSTVSVDLIGDLDLDVSLIWDRIEMPNPDSDSSVPEQDDYQVIVSLAYDF
ncbi:MAG: DUF481 domain-containing protein [Pontiella sp.]